MNISNYKDAYIDNAGEWVSEDHEQLLLDAAEMNKDFEQALRFDCERFLKDAGNAENYAKMTLDELWDGSNYSDISGTLNYFEIPGAHTKDGVPHVVNI